MFDLTKNDNVVIYGYSWQGIEVYNKLKNKGFKVMGFFDKNADDYKKSCENISEFNSPFFDGSYIKETVVIILLQNIMQHEIVVEKFSELWL